MAISLATNKFRSERMDIYLTQKGNILAVDANTDAFCDSEQLRKFLKEPGCIDVYIQILGMPEEA